jgi:hypothetical protein
MHTYTLCVQPVRIGVDVSLLHRPTFVHYLDTRTPYLTHTPSFSPSLAYYMDVLTRGKVDDVDKVNMTGHTDTLSR